MLWKNDSCFVNISVLFKRTFNVFFFVCIHVIPIHHWLYKRGNNIVLFSTNKSHWTHLFSNGHLHISLKHCIFNLQMKLLPQHIEYKKQYISL